VDRRVVLNPGVKMWASSACVAVVCALVVAVVGQGVCEPWSGRPAVCEPYLRFHAPAHRTPPVFVPAALGSQAALEALFEENFGAAVNAAPTECRKAATQLACLTALPTCAHEMLVLGNATLQLPRFVCRSVCEGVNAACHSVGLRVDCSVLEPTTGLPLYPHAATDFAPGLAVPCYGTTATPPARIPVACPRGFVYWADDDQCLPTCPDAYALYSDRQRLVLLALRWLTTLVAIAVYTYLIVPGVCVQKRRRFPLYIPIVFFATHLGLVLAWTLGQFVHPNDWICRDAVHYRDRTDPACHVQGLFAAFFVICTAMWYAIMSLNVLMPIVSESWMRSERTMGIKAAEAVQHLVGWGIPLALVVESEIRGTLATILPDLGYCTTGDYEDRNKIVDNEILFTIGTLFGLLFLFLSVAILSYRRLFMHMEWGFKSAAKRMWKSTNSQLQFTAFFSVVGIYMTFFTWYYWVVSNEITDELRKYSECNAQGFNDCEAKDVLPFPVMVLFYFFGGPYVPVCALYVFGRHGWVTCFWRRLFVCGHESESSSHNRSRSSGRRPSTPIQDGSQESVVTPGGGSIRDMSLGRPLGVPLT